MSPRGTRRERLANTVRSKLIWRPFCQVTATSAESSWKPVIWTRRVSTCMPQRKTKFRFRKKGSARPSFVQLKWTFTRSNRYQTMNFFLEFEPMNLCTMEELRLRTVVETGNKAKGKIALNSGVFYQYWLGVLLPALSQTLRGQRGKRERLGTRLIQTLIKGSWASPAPHLKVWIQHC